MSLNECKLLILPYPETNNPVEL